MRAGSWLGRTPAERAQGKAFVALLGAVLALLTLSRWHDRALESVARRR